MSKADYIEFGIYLFTWAVIYLCFFSGGET